jgi:hypothetical protein
MSSFVINYGAIQLRSARMESHFNCHTKKINPSSHTREYFVFRSTKEVVQKGQQWVSRSPVKNTGQAYRDTENELFSITQRHEILPDC